MVLNYIPPQPISEPDHNDDSTVWTANTPPATVMNDLPDAEDLFSSPKSRSSVPWPGSTFMIRHAATGHIITLHDGRIQLLPLGSRGSIYWACVETKGWLGFKNTITGCFLGHNFHGNLVCVARKHLGWENFEARLRPEGGYVLLMTHFERLWHVGVRMDMGTQRLAKLGDGAADGEVWEFVKD
jgi:hypothetical protein